MPTFTIRCECGELFHADEQSVGRRLKCRRCGRSVEVRRPGRAAAHATGRTAAWAPDPRPPGSSRSGTAGRSSHRARTSARRRLWELARRARGAFAPRSRVALPATPLARALWVLSWGYLAAAVLAAVLLWSAADRWWPATVLLFAGRWVLLVPLAVLLPAALLVRRALVLPLALAALVVVGPVMGFNLGWRRWLPRPAGQPLRVVTLNANAGDRLAIELPLRLAEWEPDVVALQECGPRLVEATRRAPGWFHHDVGGLCLLSRYPIRDTLVMDRSALEDVKRYDAAGIGGAGYVVRYAIQTPQGPVSLTNLHLETARKGLEGLASGDLRRLRLNTTLRAIESRVARRWVDRGGAPVLVVGDFNTPVESRVFRESWGDLADAFSHAGFGLGATRHNGWIRVRIDHVLFGPEWRAHRAVVGRDVGSDHRPLIADLTLVGGGR